MKRLTYFENGHWRLDFNGCQYQAGFVDRLADYEDTGLTPEQCAEYGKADREGRYIVLRDAEQEGVKRLRELAEADKEGRVAVLPFKVGDTVWTNMSVVGDRYRLADRPYPVKVVFFGCGVKKRFFHIAYSNERVLPFDETAIGKRVFLTREEAEAALKEAQNGKSKLD